MSQVERVDLQFADGPERGCVWETDDLQVMRMRLPVGGALPHHNSNANVLLVPVQGTIKLVTPEQTEVLGVGEAASVAYDTPMDVSNGGEEPALLMVLKAPHPKTFPRA